MFIEKVIIMEGEAMAGLRYTLGRIGRSSGSSGSSRSIYLPLELVRNIDTVKMIKETASQT